AAALALMAAIVYIAFKARSNGGRTGPEIHSIAILLLENLSGDPQQEYFADGMTEELISDLGQVSALRVTSRTSAMTYKGTKKTVPEIAHELGVDSVVEGSVLREGKQARITAQLIRFFGLLDGAKQRIGRWQTLIGPKRTQIGFRG